MPIYEYRCAKCEATHEVLQRLSDPAPDVCPSCGSDRGLQKLVSQTSFQLKGDGWYKDLYGKPAPKTEKPEKAESKAVACDAAPASGGCANCPAASQAA